MQSRVHGEPVRVSLVCVRLVEDIRVGQDHDVALGLGAAADGVGVVCLLTAGVGHGGVQVVENVVQGLIGTLERR